MSGGSGRSRIPCRRGAWPADSAPGRGGYESAPGRPAAHQSARSCGVVLVRRTEVVGKRDTPRIYEKMMLAARLAATRRAKAGLTAPFFAGTLEASNAARSQSIGQRRPSSSSNTRCSLRHTPASFQSRSRRQQVFRRRSPFPAGASPKGSAPEHEQDAREHLAVIQQRSPAPRLAPPTREQRLDPPPQSVPDQFRRHASLLQPADPTSIFQPGFVRRS